MIFVHFNSDVRMNLHHLFSDRKKMERKKEEDVKKVGSLYFYFWRTMIVEVKRIYPDSSVAWRQWKVNKLWNKVSENENDIYRYCHNLLKDFYAAKASAHQPDRPRPSKTLRRLRQ